jgi:hypothetical protein
VAAQDGVLQYQEHVSQLAQLGDQASAAQHELQRQVRLLNARCCLTTVPSWSAAHPTASARRSRLAAHLALQSKAACNTSGSSQVQQSAIRRCGSTRVVALGVKRSPSSGIFCNNLLARGGSGFRHRAPLCSWSCTQPALCRGCCWECQDLGTQTLGRSPGATHQL